MVFLQKNFQLDSPSISLSTYAQMIRFYLKKKKICLRIASLYSYAFLLLLFLYEYLRYETAVFQSEIFLS